MLPQSTVATALIFNWVASVHLWASSLQNLAVPDYFYILSVSLWNDLGDPVTKTGCGSPTKMGCASPTVWDFQVSRAGPIPFYWNSCSLNFFLLLFSTSILSFYGLVLWGLGSSDWSGVNRSLPTLYCQPCLIIIITIIIISIYMHKLWIVLYKLWIFLNKLFKIKTVLVEDCSWTKYNNNNFVDLYSSFFTFWWFN